MTKLATAQLLATQELGFRSAVRVTSEGSATADQAVLLGASSLWVDISPLVGDEAAAQEMSRALSPARRSQLPVAGAYVNSIEALRTLAVLGCTRMSGAAVSEPVAASAVATELAPRHDAEAPAERLVVERRVGPRLPLLLFPDRAERVSKLFETGPSIDAAIVDLSEAGMQLRTSSEIGTDELVRVLVELPGDVEPEPLVLESRVVAQQPVGAAFRINAEHVGLSLMARHRIARFIARETAGRTSRAA